MPAHGFRRGGRAGAAELSWAKFVIGMSRRIWKEGAPKKAATRVRRARVAEVALRIRRSRGAERHRMGRKGEAKAGIPEGLKGRLMRVQLTRLSAAAFAMSVALAGSAFAQTPAKPAAPGQQPAPGAQGQPAPPPPSKVDLVSPEPQWAKFCAKEPANGRDACATMRDFSTSADQPPMISINLFEVAGEEKRKLRFLILPIGMLLRPGFRVIIDKSEPLEGKYDMCFQNACSAEIEIGPKTLAELKKGQNMAVVMRVPGGDVSGREITFNIPLKDLGTVFDGKPTDPKVLEQQRQALQQQLQKKAEEQRKMLEQQQSGAAPAPAAPAPAAPAAPAKK
jgi:invasion protein IalB